MEKSGETCTSFQEGGQMKKIYGVVVASLMVGSVGTLLMEHAAKEALAALGFIVAAFMFVGSIVLIVEGKA